MTCTVLRVEPPVLFEHTHFVDGVTVRWELESVPEGTVLHFDQHVANVDDAVEGCWMVGMYTSLARLEPALAGAPVPWDWDLFGAARAHYAELGLAAPDPEAGR